MLSDFLAELSHSNFSLLRKIRLGLRFLLLGVQRSSKYWTRTSDRLGMVSGEEGYILRRVFYKRYFKKLGKSVKIGMNVKFFFPQNIVLSDNVGINENCYINGHSGIAIGERTLVGPYSMIHSANHKIPERSKRIFDSGYIGKKITIESDVLISAHCCVLAGVKMGEGSVAAAGSVVNKEVSPFVVVGGVPAVQIKERA